MLVAALELRDRTGKCLKTLAICPHSVGTAPMVLNRTCGLLADIRVGAGMRQLVGWSTDCLKVVWVDGLAYSLITDWVACGTRFVTITVDRCGV